MTVAVHAEWCSMNVFDPGEDGYECDCGGNGGRCSKCGADGPCGWGPNGEPLICKT